MTETPEQKARHDIDVKLAASGWLVQDRDDLDLTAGRGIAVREFPMKAGFGYADYLLYLDRKAVGAVEAKAAGALTGVEAQSAKYAAGLPDNLPAHRRPLPFLFESNGAVSFFTNGLDPKPRSRKVFSFPRPETLAEWLAQPASLRARLAVQPIAITQQHRPAGFLRPFDRERREFRACHFAPLLVESQLRI